MKLRIQIYGQIYEIPLTKGIKLQCGDRTPSEVYDGEQDLEWLHEQLIGNCLGNGTVFTIGDWHFVSLHINGWQFLPD